MKKFVLISDGKNFSKKTFDFVKSLYEKEAFLLTGAFFHSINYESLTANTVAPEGDFHLAHTKHENDTYLKGIKEFKTLCLKNNIEHRIHQENEEWNLDDLVKESRFTDLVIVSGELFFNDVEEDQPNHFLSEVLKHAECPVLVVPEGAKPIKRVAVAYNGKRESMHALKMFCTVFSQFTDLPVDIDYWTGQTDDEIPDLDYLEEFAGRHFTNVNFRERFFDPRKYLAKWLIENKDTLFVCGSYHRSNFSNWFKKSFAEDIIKNHSSAIFIAHSC